MMNYYLNKKVSILLFLVFLILNGCTDNLGSIFSPGNQTNVNNKVVRGPTGVGSGGGVIIVEDNGTALPDTKYEIYIQENGSKVLLQNGTTDREGKVQLSESKLNSDRIRKLQDGTDRIIVEIYNGDLKTAVGGKVIVQNDNGNDTEIELNA